MKVLSLCHIDDGVINMAENRFCELGHDVDKHFFMIDNSPPSIDSFDVLAIFGGYMSAYEEKKYSWLSSELSFVEKVCSSGKPVFGICLGSQILARVLGGRAYQHAIPEIGFWPVTLTASGKTSPFFRGFESAFEVFEWHFDSFDMPPGAVRLAERSTCLNQAFSWGEKIFAVQFHLEFSYDQVKSMLEKKKNFIPENGIAVSPISEILANPSKFDNTAKNMRKMVDNFINTTCKNIITINQNEEAD